MSQGERSLTGLEKRASVKAQVMKVYEEFKKEKAEADKLLQEFLEAFEAEVPQGHDEDGPATPVSHNLTPNVQSGMGSSSSNELDLLRTLVRTQQEFAHL